LILRCHLFKLKCTKFDFGWGSTLDPAGGRGEWKGKGGEGNGLRGGEGKG